MHEIPASFDEQMEPSRVANGQPAWHKEWGNASEENEEGAAALRQGGVMVRDAEVKLQTRCEAHWQAPQQTEKYACVGCARVH
jgi:hypothetical protein